MVPNDFYLHGLPIQHKEIYCQYLVIRRHDVVYIITLKKPFDSINAEKSGTAPNDSYLHGLPIQHKGIYCQYLLSTFHEFSENYSLIAGSYL